MDKFGIFKLLTSAYEFYQKNSKNKKDENATINKDDFLSSILNFNKKQEEQQTDNQTPPKQKTAKPLSQIMFSTMSNHEEFVKRVMKRNKK